MTQILHIIASPRGEASRTLRISKTLLRRFQREYPDAIMDELDLFKENLPSMSAVPVRGKYALMGGGLIPGEVKPYWKDIERHIKRFLCADIIVISTPMWNFSIPYVLKQYIDVIVQPKYLFRFTDKGVDGLAKGKKMIVVTSRGGDYGPESPARDMDFQEPYLRAIFGFVGISGITFVNAQPMDSGNQELAERRIQEAVAQLEKIAVEPQWAGAKA